MTDHILVDVNGSELFPVVNHYGMSDHIREDRTSSGPGLERFLLIFGVQLGDLLHEMIVDEWALFNTSCHWINYLFLFRFLF